MLISKTFCPAGSLAYIVPTGLQVTLHYDARGILTNVFEGFGTEKDMGEDFMKSLVKMGLIPNAVKLTGGSTEIWGAFYSKKFTAPLGLLPNCEYENIKKDIMSGSIGYKFYAGCLKSGATNIIDPTSMTSWITMSRMDMMPNWSIPENANDDMLRQYLSMLGHEFEFPFIAGYIVYERGVDPYYVSTDILTAKVDKVKKYTNTNGNIMYDVTYGENKITMNYPDAARYNVLKGSQILLSRSHVIWCSDQVSTNTNRLSKRITCEYCGKILDVPESGVMTCNDTMCPSFLFDRVFRFCDKLGIESPTVAQTKKYIKSETLQILPDLLLLPEYAELKIECHLWKLLSAIIPAEIGVTDDWLRHFCNRCNNDYKTVKYYLDGPKRITTELNIDVIPRLLRWLNAHNNISDIDTIINSEQISLINSGKLQGFDAPQLLRNKTIFITGTFTHGTLVDITTILQSYGATVVTSFDEFIQYVLVGDIKDGIDGEAIIGARALHIPVVDESEFFAHYEIDKDLENNLV